MKASCSLQCDIHIYAFKHIRAQLNDDLKKKVASAFQKKMATSEQLSSLSGFQFRSISESQKDVILR